MNTIRPRSTSHMALFYVAALMLSIVIPQTFSLHRFVGPELYFSMVVYISSFFLIFLGVLGGYRSLVVNFVLLLVTVALTYLLAPEGLFDSVGGIAGNIDLEIAVIEWPPKITLAYLVALLNQIYTWFK